MTNATNVGIPMRPDYRPEVRQSSDLHPNLQKDYSSRVDRRGERAQSDALQTLPPYGSPSRGDINGRRHISAAEAMTTIAT